MNSLYLERDFTTNLSCISTLNFDTCLERKTKKKWKLNEPLTSANRIESPSNALPIILSGELTSKSNQSRRILTNEGTTVQRGRGKNEQENRQYEEREDGQKDEKSFLAHHYDEAASAEC